MYVCTYVRMYVCTYVRTYVRTYVCMYVCLSIYIYTSFPMFRQPYGPSLCYARYVMHNISFNLAYASEFGMDAAWAGAVNSDCNSEP